MSQGRKTVLAKELTLADRERLEIEDLEKRIKQTAPARGELSVSKDGDGIKFSNLPISKLTQKGLARAKYEVTTEIQRHAIPHALAGRDILGAAKTGSGKTLAFLIPLVEDLFREQWSREDGVGGLIISPTRELAMQIYEVLRVVLHYHAFTCGLLLGGTDYEKELRVAWKSQVIVATPGRLLQHLEQTPNFELGSTLRVLVLDEADRLLDLGFREQLEAIIGYLPSSREDGGLRQTMLFSATQTRSVRDLARLSLRDPEFISIHERDKEVTPEGLRQLYVQSSLGDKMDVVYSFIKSHLKSKVIMFFSSCRQVKFVDTAFRRMRPGMPVMALHGKQSHSKRMEIYEDFCSRPAACLFATDVAARGLDFPNVDWVVQVDCPEDAAAYIHRVGRTARYKNKGNALLVLLPSEERAFLDLLKTAKVPIQKLGVNPLRKESIREKLRSLLIADPELKNQAQRAFKSYLRSVHLQPNSKVFDVKQLSFKELAESYGLAAAPRLKLPSRAGEAGRAEAREKKTRNYQLEHILEEDERKGSESDQSEDEVMDADGGSAVAESILRKKKQSSEQRLINRKAKQRAASADEEFESDSDDEELLVRKSNGSTQDAIEVKEKPKKTRLKPIKFIDDFELRGTKMRPKLEVFDDDDDDVQEQPSSSNFVQAAAERLRREDKFDREQDKARVREKHKEKRAKEKRRRLEDQELAEGYAVLGGASEESDNESVHSAPKRIKHAAENDYEEEALRLIEQS